MTFSFEDFEVGSAVQLGAHTFSREEIVGFAQRYDPQPFHLAEAGGEALAFRRTDRERLEHLFRDDGHSRARHAERFDIDGFARPRQYPLAEARARRRHGAPRGARARQARLREQAGSRHRFDALGSAQPEGRTRADRGSRRRSSGCAILRGAPVSSGPPAQRRGRSCRGGRRDATGASGKKIDQARVKPPRRCHRRPSMDSRRP